MTGLYPIIKRRRVPLAEIERSVLGETKPQTAVTPDQQVAAILDGETKTEKAETQGLLTESVEQVQAPEQPEEPALPPTPAPPKQGPKRQIGHTLNANTPVPKPGPVR
jgi:hypothetical protein